MKNKFGMMSLLLGTMLISVMTITSCSKDDDDNGNNGKTDPSTIAASNLIAYFPFENEEEDVQFSNNTITFSQSVGEAMFDANGRRGNAYKGDTSESYLVYNVASGSALKNVDEITITAWIKTPHTTAGAAKIFGLTGGDSFMGNLTIIQESQALGDSVDMKFYLYDSESPEWKGQDIRVQNSKFTSDIWFHLVALYNKSNSTMQFYANGDSVTSSIRYAGPDPEDGDQPLLGPIRLGQDMDKIYIGAWPQQVAGTPESWMTYYKGMLDELRIYNKALSPQEIEDLYEAEVSQIE